MLRGTSSKFQNLQIGRSSEDQIDFTIVDTWLASASGGSNSPHQSASNSAKNNHNSKHDDKRLSSTISRYFLFSKEMKMFYFFLKMEKY